MINNEFYIRDFTKEALLNNTALDWICPPNCQKNKITQVGNSALEALIKSKNDPFSNEVKGYYHIMTKPIKAVARVAYIGLVLLTISPLSMLFRVGLVGKNLSEYSFKKYVKGVDDNDSNQLATAERIKTYAKVLLSDASYVATGAATATLLYLVGSMTLLTSKGLYHGVAVTWGNGVIYHTVDKVVYLALGLSGLGFIPSFFGAYSPSKILSRIVADRDDRASMYLALEMRNKLGLVNEEGGLLKFSDLDGIKVTTSEIYRNRYVHTFHGEAPKKLAKLICDAEMDLLDLVLQANAWMKKNGLEPLPFSYPFNGKDVVKKIKSAIKTSNKDEGFSFFKKVNVSTLSLYNKNRDGLKELINNLEKVHYKIQLSRDMYQSAHDTAIQMPIWLDLAALAFQGELPKTAQINQPISYVNQAYYQYYFQCGGIPMDNEQPNTENEQDPIIQLKKFYQQVELESLNPQKSAEPQKEMTYQLFLYKLRVNKWKMEQNNGQVLLKQHELVGLEDEYTHAEMKDAIRGHRLALHPDKHQNSDESAKLFKYYNQIRLVIDPYKKS